MLLISKQQRDRLKALGLLKDKRTRFSGVIQDANYYVCNRKSKSRKKSIFVTEDPEILLALEQYELLGYIKITQEQLKKLMEVKLVWSSIIAQHGDYNPDATVFIDYLGNIWVKDKNYRIKHYLSTGELLAPKKKENNN